MNIIDFIKLSNEVKEAMGIKLNKNPIITHTATYKKYLGESQKNLDIIEEAMTRPGETLIYAGCGGGKTYAIQKCFESINNKESKKLLLDTCSDDKETYKILYNQFKGDESFKETIFILTCPNKIQNLSNEQYGMTACVSGTTSGDLYNKSTEAIAMFSSVYDKFEKLREFVDRKITENPALRIILVVDESHLLQQQLSFREDAIKGLEDFISFVKGRNGSVLYLTGTIEPLMIRNFDTILEFKKEEEEGSADLLHIYRNKTKHKISTFAADVIENKLTKPFVRMNSIKAIQDVKHTLTLDGYDVTDLDSSQKFYTEVNKADGSKEVVYNNPLYDAVIKNAALNTRDGSKSNQALLSTSLLDVGTSITSIDGIQDAKISPTFVIDGFRGMDLNAITQFFARIRYRVNSYNILIKYAEPVIRDIDGSVKGIKVFKDFVDIIEQEQKMLDFSLDSHRKSLKAIKKKYTWDHSIDEKTKEEEIRKQMNYILNYTSLADGEKNDMGCIYITDKLTIDYDKKLFFNHCYNKYMGQYYYHQDKFMDEIAKRLNIKNVIMEDITTLSDNIKDCTLDIKKVFNTALTDENAVKQILENKIEDDELRKVRQTKTYSDVQELINLKRFVEDREITNQELSDIINVSTTMKRKDVQTIKDELLKSVVKALNMKHYKEYINGNMDISDFKDKEKQAMQCILHSKYATYFSQCIRRCISTKGLIKIFMTEKNCKKNEKVH